MKIRSRVSPSRDLRELKRSNTPTIDSHWDPITRRNAVRETGGRRSEENGEAMDRSGAALKLAATANVGRKDEW